LVFEATLSRESTASTASVIIAARHLGEGIAVALEYGRFIAFSNIILGTFVGVLIALPLTPTVSSAGLSAALVLGSALLGGAIGRKRGESRGFLYFALVAVLVLSSVISRAFVPPTPG
jgi:hypothetical protein